MKNFLLAWLHTLVRRVTRDARPACAYCTRSAVVVVHDRRGCAPCCREHALWRRTTSTIGGHGEDCADRAIAGPGAVTVL